MKDQIQYSVIEGIPNQEQMEELLTLYTTIFKDAQPKFFIERIETKTQLLCLIACDGNIPVGFKIGYQYNPNTFYSWVGGVLENYRKKGIAKTLALLQEKWVRKSRFSKLRTKSMNQYKPMLILNLKNGFDIVQVYSNEKGQTKIVFEKEF
ncbi:hypothetical protein WH52_13360 [Tenacibaculum holothuriorum]|uniref:N-acetyltransferase domain-containing protein n=1 Tax=Tenacibaculum holothuriorum TaxID=1635173 RepID=A0A1Y2P9C8_9FLAO|nr:GNAT family N-acetyltransferase [Tenacibaculum holothuriorum]OSY87046.1 hypothetical protein WH52_13360 [Tenacibaculum holothuriorum]